MQEFPATQVALTRGNVTYLIGTDWSLDRQSHEISPPCEGAPWN